MGDLKSIKNYLSTKYKEREEVIDSMIIATIARQHVLLIGPPGTAKSALVSDYSNLISGGEYFQWLLTRFSTPEELFGPVELKALEQGVYKRNTSNKLPHAHIAFLDEIFKANSAILNALLTLINERVFYNNGGIVHSPLFSVIGASNEYPEEGEGLEALFDRFLLRHELEYLGEDNHFMQMLQGTNLKKPNPISVADIENLQMLADMVNLPQELFDTLVHIRTELMNEGIRPSDRRFKQGLELIKAKVVYEGRQEAKVSDLVILKDCLWEEVSDKKKTREIVEMYAADKLEQALKEIKQQGNDVFQKAKDSKSSEAGLEASQKLKSLLDELNDLDSKFPNRVDEIQVIRDQVEKARETIGEVLLGI